MDLRIERLTPAHAADYLAFFDHERGPAFADNPEWATCYCHYYEVPPALDWKKFDGGMNRRAMAARIEVGEMDGYLAYDGEGVVGWMNAQPYHKLRFACDRMRIPAPPLPVPPHEAAAIVCFVVHPERRRQGISRALLAHGLDNLAARGLALVDAFPWNVGPGDNGPPRNGATRRLPRRGRAPWDGPAALSKPADFYHGSLSMFTAAGFERVATHENVTVVRKHLG